MGLDQYIYAEKDGTKTEIGYMRKHNWIHGFFEELWKERGKPLPKEWDKERIASHGNNVEFNCVPLRLYIKDINKIMTAIRRNKLNRVDGFFFGDWGPDNDTKKEELKIFEKAKEYIRLGYKVSYDSWW